ncbi:MAG: peptidase C1 [Acidobacteria bacterium]|nr:peptidase C1 [Acidobacteriota bacterium]
MRRIGYGLILVMMAAVLVRADDERNRARYDKHKEDPVLKQMSEDNKKAAAERQKETTAIRERQKEEKEAERQERRALVSDLSGVTPPGSVAEFEAPFHFAPVRQHLTGSCWSFSATSFFEAEIFRLTGKKIKLSEIWTVYYEFLEKSRRFIRERGASYVSHGSEFTSVLKIWDSYGMVPAAAYPGLPEGKTRHDHSALMDELEAYLDMVKAKDMWDEDDNLRHVALILDKYLGPPPREFTYNGRQWTPRQFLAEATGLHMDDYHAVMSTLYFPFYTCQELRAPDNWWHCDDFINLPLDEWYATLQAALAGGYTAVLGGDVSEPGKLGMADVAFVPTFDIPAAHIDQSAREYRMVNKSTTDDHAIHAVGHTRVGDFDWYLIKDSGSSATWGQYEGYYLFRDDYVRLKMLFFAVHKDALADILPRLEAAAVE